ncbi:hypothetical protein ACIBG0_40770 [Nocardia sp. NPDC050630]|uniref:hypothetical protein n=1 Tax=Nocardia sp. NPDC050630 TaxID=3364321 RepID=UPI0037B8C930
MDSKTECELRADFQHWLELVDHAAHAENEVEREKSAQRAVELEQKWRCIAAEDGNALHELQVQ